MLSQQRITRDELNDELDNPRSRRIWPIKTSKKHGIKFYFQ